MLFYVIYCISILLCFDLAFEIRCHTSPAAKPTSAGQTQPSPISASGSMSPILFTVLITGASESPCGSDPVRSGIAAMSVNAVVQA